MPLPQIKVAFSNWTTNISCIKNNSESISSSGYVVQSQTTFNVKGVVQPFKAKDLELKPEGERGWGWQMVHIPGNTALLDVGDFIMANGIQYKVMHILNYQAYNYTEYDVIQYYE